MRCISSSQCLLDQQESHLCLPVTLVHTNAHVYACMNGMYTYTLTNCGKDCLSSASLHHCAQLTNRRVTCVDQKRCYTHTQARTPTHAHIHAHACTVFPQIEAQTSISFSKIIVQVSKRGWPQIGASLINFCIWASLEALKLLHNCCDSRVLVPGVTPTLPAVPCTPPQRPHPALQAVASLKWAP